MTIGEISLSWGRERARKLLTEMEAWLAAEARAQRWHLDLTSDVGCLATLGELPSVRETVEGILRAAPEAAFHAGVITNVSDPGVFVRRTLPERESSEASFPRYSDTIVRVVVESCSEPHVQCVLAGDFDDADAHAITDLAREELASTYAVLGQIERTLAMIRSDDFPNERREGPLMISCVESFRSGDYERAARLADELFRPSVATRWSWIHVAAGFLDRIPWDGYPYPDY